MQDAFLALADGLFVGLAPDERVLLYATGERSNFVRYNRAAVRQAGEVHHNRVLLRLVCGRRHAGMSLDLAGDGRDLSRAKQALQDLRGTVAVMPEDPHLLLPDTAIDSENCTPSTLPDAVDLSSVLLDAVAGTDFVGVLTVGPMFRGFADSAGQRNLFERSSFLLSSSIYAHTDKAEKLDMAGLSFDAEHLRAKVATVRERLPLLHRKPKELKPGDYRAYLSPPALAGFFGLITRDSFSEAAMRRRVCSILEVQEGKASLSPLLTIDEDTAGGLGPAFDEKGFIRPPQVRLMEEGKAACRLVNPKSAAEYGLTTNGASLWESADSVRVAPGDLAEADALHALGTGLYVSRVHYLNYSDQSNGRITGLTRFASHWVEEGEIVAPLQVMRFDDSIARILGTELEALTDRVALTPTVYDYNGRQTTSYRTPGALLKGLRLAL